MEIRFPDPDTTNPYRVITSYKYQEGSHVVIYEKSQIQLPSRLVRGMLTDLKYYPGEYEYGFGNVNLDIMIDTLLHLHQYDFIAIRNLSSQQIHQIVDNNIDCQRYLTFITNLNIAVDMLVYNILNYNI